MTTALLLAALGCRDDIQPPTDAAPTTPEESVMAAATALAFQQVSGALEHTCGVTLDALAYCWGDNRIGMLGVSTSGREQQPAPVAVIGRLRFKQVSAGHRLTCGVTTDSLALCWGDNSAGGLGNGSRTGPERCDTEDVVEGIPCSTRPVAVSGGLRFAQIAAGSGYACGVTSTDRRAWCWGVNGSGQLGDGHRDAATAGGGRRRAAPPPGEREVSAHVRRHDRRQGVLLGRQQPGPARRQHGGRRSAPPHPVSGTRQFRQVDAGVAHTCGVTTGDRAFCWGDGRAGQLGNGKTYLSFWPRAVAGGLALRRVTAGSSHSCGETPGNQAYCWGNSGGALGDGTGMPRLKPVAVAEGLSFKQVNAGWDHTCARTAAGALYCWGLNASGQLGDGTHTDRLTPTRVAGGT